MKILAINSSHRGKNGFTQVLIDQIKDGAIAAKADFETVILADHKLNQCLGCEVCHTEKSYLKCVYDNKDDVKTILQKMAGANIIIYATPIYVFNMSALMKKFIDRLNSTSDINKIQVSKTGLFFHHIDVDICSKPFVLLTTCGNIEDETSKNVVSYFKTFSKFMDAPMVGTLVRKSSSLLQHKDEKTFTKKAIVLDAFREAGKELATVGKISSKTQKLATRNVIEMPLIIHLLMKIQPFRAKLVQEGLKRNVINMK